MKIQHLIVAVVVIVLSLNSFAENNREYKPYVTDTAAENVVFRLVADAGEWTFIIGDDSGATFVVANYEIQSSEEGLKCGRDIILNRTQFVLPGLTVEPGDIYSIDVETDSRNGKITLSFIGYSEDQKESAFRRRSRDVVSFGDLVTVKKDDFVRGSVIAFDGDAEILGEVNRDVVALRGDILLGPGAVVRGGAIAPAGEVTIDRSTSVYGIVRRQKGVEISRRHRVSRWKKHDNEITFAGTGGYNRVDGLTILSGLEYDHLDSLLPAFRLFGGYAFASDRWRYDLSIRQTIVRGRAPLDVGGQVFRLLKSSDDHLINNSENSLYALLFNEDWKDYYEAEGAYGFLRFSPLGWNRLEIGYLSETQRWLDAHPLLWSLFGKKEFRGNFSSVPYADLMDFKEDFDDKSVTSLNIDYTLDTRDHEKNFRRGWYGRVHYEYSPERWKGDFEFSRLHLLITRYQRLGWYQSLVLTGAYGYVEGDYIPLNRKFFLGGLGTLHGYRHKEFMGNEYVQVGAEYYFHIPKSGLCPFIHYDGGKISRQDRLGSGDTWINSAGLGIDIDNNFKVFLSRRMDCEGADPVFYVRFEGIGDFWEWAD